MNNHKYTNTQITRSKLTIQKTLSAVIMHTFTTVAQSVAFQCDFRFELFTTQITDVTSVFVVSVHMSLQVTPTTACIVTHGAEVWLQTYKHRHNDHFTRKTRKKLFLS